MRLKILMILVLALMVLVACDSKERVEATDAGQPAAKEAAMAAGHKIHVEEVVMAPSYMYLRVTEDGKEYWIATTNQPVEVGMTLYFDEGMEMKDFEVKELDRTFESLWFVGLLKSENSTMTRTGHSVSPYGGEDIQQQSNIAVDKLSDGVTVAELFASPGKYAGKTVSIRAKVTKFNANIMGRNWVHLQDGTKHGDNFDVTLTTKETVKVGDEVVFMGTVVLNKDFGAGYQYDVILEEGTLATKS
ncbi:MAG: GW dipeptide domain-containing protein [Candidatus Marinimicrobia bacterium]|nr:GW dipeptide domain-containing protein [Candidatus Neomarinimicrobiota bacterium]MCF7903531.1 GW dipeptide domain-containing protein [Candidatus Neomarinimicrobiota bacterium]